MLKQKRNFNKLSESNFTKKIKVTCQTAKLAKLPNQYMQNIIKKISPMLTSMESRLKFFVVNSLNE